MSNQPEQNEIEEGEIVSESESEEVISVTETEDEPIDDEIDMDEDEMMFEDDGVDVATLMTSLLATEDGDTVCTALVSITQQLQMQNKILIKILSELKN
jgi:hypothetical protein|tara:strand:- start:4937 stop:5233 length:297 start_codon:yes stop_codon:yes gene_type:complete